MGNLGTIEGLAKEFAGTRETLKARVETLEDEIAALKRKHLPAIKKAAAATMEKQSLLKAAIEEAPALFVKPKTLVIHGVKLGFRKQKGEASWQNQEAVIKLIKKHFPLEAEILIKTTEKPIKTALLGLPGSDLKKLGVTVTNDTDEVVIKSTDSDIDKLVGALLKDDEELQEVA